MLCLGNHFGNRWEVEWPWELTLEIVNDCLDPLIGEESRFGDVTDHILKDFLSGLEWTPLIYCFGSFGSFDFWRGICSSFHYVIIFYIFELLF